MTVTGVLSEGLVTPNTTFTLPYSIQVADRVIHDAENRGTETFSVAQILKYSSNVGAITLAEKLGATRLDALDRTASASASRPASTSRARSRGLVLPLEQWSGSTIGNVPIGQGIAVTPIQMASVYAAVANDGVWVQPHLVVARRRPRRRSRRRTAGSCRRPSTKQIKAMLTDVVVRGHRHRGRDPGLHGRRQDRHGAEAGRPRRLLGLEVRRVVRRHGAGVEAAPRRAGRWSTSRAARSGAASSPRRRSRRSRSSTCSTSRCRRTRPRGHVLDDDAVAARAEPVRAGLRFGDRAALGPPLSRRPQGERRPLLER